MQTNRAVRVCAKGGTQVSAKSGIFSHVGSQSGDAAPTLTVVESVRCLECGAVYTKPAGGGTVRENPGCPDCGYVGWIATELIGVLEAATSQRHRGAGPQPHRHG